MCHGSTSRPPIPPVAGDAGGGRPVILEANDGNRFTAFSATTDAPNAPGVVILPDVRGLHPFYEELALSEPAGDRAYPRFPAAGRGGRDSGGVVMAEDLFRFPWPGPGNSEGPVDPDRWLQVQTNDAPAAGLSGDGLLSTYPWPGPGDSEA